MLLRLSRRPMSTHLGRPRGRGRQLIQLNMLTLRNEFNVPRHTISVMVKSRMKIALTIIAALLTPRKMINGHLRTH